MIEHKTNVEHLFVGDQVKIGHDDIRLVTKVKRTVQYNNTETNNRYEIFTIFLNNKPYDLLRGDKAVRISKW